MDSAIELFAATFVAALLWMLLAWLISLPKRDVSIVDAFWGPGFALAAVVSWALGGGWEGRKTLLLVLTAVWGLRLGIYLLWRNLKAGEEDYRYRQMRERSGPGFALRSLVVIFALQGALVWFISLPLQISALATAPARWTFLDGLGVSLWAIGLFFETVGDWQLTRFKANPDNRGKVLNSGLWRYTRHPNYFGDFLVWWGLWLVALSTPWGWATLASPVLMSFLLMRVTGGPLLEKKLRTSRPEYREYIERTSAFFPRPPQRRAV